MGTVPTSPKNARRALTGTAGEGAVMATYDGLSPHAFPVKVEAIVAFVDAPMAAYRAINDHVTSMPAVDRAQMNEGIKFSFVFQGIRHDVTLTLETPQ